MQNKVAVSVVQLYGEDADWVQGYGSYSPLAKKEMLDKLGRLGLGGSKQLYCIHALASWFNPVTWRTVPTIGEMAVLLHRSPRQVRRIRAELVAEGLLKIKLPRGWPEGKPTGRPDRIDLKPLLRAIRQVQAPSPVVVIGGEEEEELPVAAAPADPIALLLAQIAADLEEELGNAKNALQRVYKAQEEAQWSEDDLEHAARAAARQAKEHARERRFGLFFADLDRRARSAKARQVQAEEEQAIFTAWEHAAAAYRVASEDGEEESVLERLRLRFERAADAYSAHQGQLSKNGGSSHANA